MSIKPISDLYIRVLKIEDQEEKIITKRGALVIIDKVNEIIDWINRQELKNKL